MASADKTVGDARGDYSPSALDGARESFSGWEPKKLWHTDANGGRSEECAWTEGFDTRADGRSLIATDLDGDGDVDLLLLNRNSPRLQLFRNDGEVGHAVTLRFEPASGTPDAAGVKVWLDGRIDEVLLHRGFASSVPPELTRGLGEKTTANVEVQWRSGARQKFRVNAGTVTTLVEKSSASREVPFVATPARGELRFPTKLADLGLEPSGTRTLVTLFLAGCEPCRKEAPALNALAKKKGVTVLGLGVANDDAQAATVAKSLGFTFEGRMVPAWVADALSTNGRLDFPTTLVFDAKGQLERVVTDVTRLP